MSVVDNDISSGFERLYYKLGFPNDDFALAVYAFGPEPFPYFILVRTDGQFLAANIQCRQLFFCPCCLTRGRETPQKI